MVILSLENNTNIMENLMMSNNWGNEKFHIIHRIEENVKLHGKFIFGCLMASITFISIVNAISNTIISIEKGFIWVSGLIHP